MPRRQRAITELAEPIWQSQLALLVSAGEAPRQDNELAEITPDEWANLRRWWFNSVHEIADLEYQRRTWLTPPDGSPHWSYVEFCCSYPDANQLRDARDRGYLSAVEFQPMAELGAAISSHTAPDQYDHRAILEDPEWHAVVATAQRVRRQLLTLLTDAVERDCLMGL